MKKIKIITCLDCGEELSSSLYCDDCCETKKENEVDIEELTMKEFSSDSRFN